jgi:phosphatidate cytidylyltransferase|tara:strand:+ start:100 stop:762 length:663 start_codon:yes stop_codon:yes gene_type:complete
MTIELKKRIFTSLLLLMGLSLMYFYVFILIGALILIGIICWIEFYSMISKIFYNDTLKNKVLRFFFKALSLFYLSCTIFFILYVKSIKPEFQMFIIYSLLVSITSDIGGFTFGKFFKGMKLTKISPNKTVAGAMGSFFFSIMLIPFFISLNNEYSFPYMIVITLLISIISQLGDLFISFLKRKAKVKDTSDLLPGHGGVLDRMDGIIFAIPLGFLLFYFN